MVKRYLSAGTIALSLLLTGVAYAKDRDDDHRRDARYQVGGYGAEYGYRDGFDQGRNDSGRNAGYNYKSREYQKGERGYQKYMGSKGQYKQRYRDAYREGYEDGYRARGGFGGIWGGNYPNRDRNGNGIPDDRERGRYPDDRNGNGIPDERERGRYPNDRNGGVYGRGSEVSNVAFDYGYQDGMYYAQRDLSRGRSANPTDAKGYKDADRGYNSRYNRDEFKRYYREGFIRGYNQEYGYKYGRR